MRVRYPEMTLSQLADSFNPPLTKSCLNHRLRKLIELGKSKGECKSEARRTGNYIISMITDITAAKLLWQLF